MLWLGRLLRFTQRKPIRDRSRLLPDLSYKTEPAVRDITLRTVAFFNDEGPVDLTDVRIETERFERKGAPFRARIHWLRAQQEVAPHGVISPSDLRTQSDAVFDDVEIKLAQQLWKGAIPGPSPLEWGLETVLGKMDDLRSVSKAAKRAYARSALEPAQSVRRMRYL